MHPDAWHVLLTLAVLVFGMYLLMNYDYGTDDVGLSFTSSLPFSSNGLSCQVSGPFLCRELYVEHTPFGVDWKKSYIVIDALTKDSFQDGTISYITTDFDTCTNLFIDHDSISKSGGREIVLRYNCEDIQPYDARLFNHQIDINFVMDDGSRKDASLKISSG